MTGTSVGGVRGEHGGAGGGTNRRKVTLDQPSPSVLGREERGSVENRGVPPLLPFKQKTLQVQK